MLIPRGLKKGTRLWYSDKKYAIVGHHEYKQHSLERGNTICHLPGPRKQLMVYLPNGMEISNDTPPICRIQRMPEKEDRDVELLLQLAETMNTEGAPFSSRRIKQVARRLKKYVEVHG